MPDNVDKLFEIMQANGAANDRNKFRKVFLTPGNKGYKIRKDIYDGLRADGIIDSPTYEDFRRKLRLGGTPTVNKYRQQMFNSADPTKNKASELTRKAVKTAHKAMDNVRKPVRGAVVNKQGKKVKEFDITPAKTLDDLNREYAQEVASDWEKEQQRQSLYNTTRSLDEVQRKIAERDAQLDEADNGFWTGIRHAAQGMNVTGGMFQQYDDDMRKELIDPKYKQYLVEANYLTQMKKQLIQEEEDAAAPNATKWDRFKHASSSFTSGMLDEAFGSDAFDFGGYIKMRESDVLLRINDRINRGVATDDDRRLLQILKDKEEVESRLDNDAYSFGRGASQSAGFVTDFLITGGGDFGGLGRLGGKMALGLARKTFAKTMTKDLGKRFAAWSLKNLGKTLGEATGAAMIATSVQVGKTAANATQRYLGLDSDDGGLEYDKDGNLKFKGGTDVGTAIAKAIASGTIENYTELLGPHITSMGKRLFGWAGVGLEKITPDALSKFFDKVGSSELFKRIGTFTDEIANSKVLNAGKKALAKVGVNDMPEEGLEEEAGIILNSLITGDNKFSDLWDKETQYKTWGGVMSMMGAMRAIPIAYSAVGTAYSASKNKVEYFKCKHDLTKAETLARQALGDKWTPIKELIDNADNKHIIEVGINIIRQSDKYSQEQAKAAQNYIGQLLKMRGFNNATMASIRDKNAKGEGQTDADKKDIEVSNAYAEGHEAEGELRHQIQLEYEKRTANLAKRLGLTPEKIDAMNVDSFSSYIGLNSDADFDIFQYKKAKAAYDGVMDNAQNLVDIAGEVAAQRVDNMTNVHDGTIRKAYKKGTEMNPDSPVYIISGNIKLNDDGSINYTDSDKMLVVYDEETGQREAMGNFMLASVDPNIQNAEEVKAQAIQAAKQKIITEQSNVIDGILAEGSEFTMESNDGSSHNYKIVQVDEQGNCIVSVDGTVLPEPLSLDAIQQQYDQSNVARSVKNDQTTQESEQTTQEPEQIQQESQSIEDKFDYDKITNENDGKVKRVDVTDEEGKNRFPNAKAVFLIQDKGAMPKFVVMDEEGNLTSYVGKRGDKIHLKGEMTIDEYKKQRQEELQMIAAENADSSMIEDNSGTIEVEDNTQPLSETDADNVIAQMESSAETAPDLELTPDNWTAEFGEDGILSTPIGDVKMGENQVAKLFEKGRSKEFGMIKPTLTNPDVIIEVPSRSTDGNEERSSSYLFIKTFLGKNGKKVYYFKSVTIKKDGLEISISSHYDRVKRVKEALMKGKLLYRKNDGAQTEQNQPSASVTTSQEDAAGSSESKDTNISSNGNENNESLTFEDGTPIPVDMNGEVDLSQTDASHAAEWYDNNLGEDADDWLDGEIKKAKKVLEQAKNKKLAGTKPSELVASKKEKEAAIADAQAHYNSAISIRDSLKERRIAKEENTSDGRRNLIEKARRKFARLKSAVKDDAEAVSQLYRDTIGSLLHRLYDGTGIDVTDTIPLTAEEYVASNLGVHSLNYEGTETSKGVKQETGLSREDFAKTQLLAADGKGTTIDALVHSLWENRPSNLESLDTQDIRNALIGVLNSGFKASEARNFVENIRIAQAENILEEQKRAQENAAYAEQQKAEQEAEQKAMSDEKAEPEAKSEEKLDNESDNESNDLSNETDNEQINDNINDNINAPEQNKFPDKLKEGSKTIEVPEDATDEKPLGEQRTDSPFSARKNGKQQTEAERAADVEKNKVDDVGLVDAVIGEKIRKSFERIAKMMGAKIQYQRTDKLGNGWIQETTDADGNVHRTIFITLDSSITKGAQFIFGHEMTHQIKHLNPAAYNELTQLVLDTYGSDAFDKAVDETMQRYSDAGFSGRARDYYAEEVVADAVGEMIRDLNLAHTLAMKMSHPLLAAIHEILQKIKLAFFGTEYSDVTKNIIRSIEQAYVKTANGEITNSETGEDVSFSLRQKPEPKKKGIGYKVFVLKDGKLYPPMVANPDGAATPVGVWLDADAAPIAGESKTGRPQVKQGGKGTQGGSGKLAYRPGWHLGVVPYAIQFNRKDAEGNKTLFPKNFVFAEVEYAADVDYQEEARQEGINPSGKYQHSLAGLKHLPTDGYYMYRTNPNPETDPWVITGAMKVNRILTRAEQAELVKNAGREPQQIQEGDIVTDDVVNSINQEIADAPKFSLKVYHGSGAEENNTNYVIFKPEDMRITEHTKFSLKSKPVRFEASKKLSDEEKKEVLSTLKDAYKVNGVPYHIEETADGKEKRVYEPTADSYVVSDITNRPLRYYITLPDGRVAHPTEVYPNISDNEVKSSATKQGLLDEEVDQIVSAAIGNMKDIADNAKAIEVLTELQNLPHETHDFGYGMNNAQSYNYKTGIFTSDAAQAIDYVVRRMRRKEDVPTEIPAALKKAVADSYGMVDNLIGGMSTTKFSLKKVNDDFNQRLEELVKNPNQKDKILRLGRSSSFLKVGGITDAEIELDFDKFIRKSGDKYKNNHPFAASDLINLPMALAEPIAVFNSTTANDHVVLTELQKDGKNFIVAVRAVEQHRKGGVVLEVNKITSLYPKEERGIVYWINNGRISNVDKEKALHFIEALQPHAGTTITDEELKSAANIINSFETTKGNGEKVDVEEPKTFDEFLNHPSLKFSIKNEEQRKAAEDAYEYASKLRPNKSSQYALVDMSNPSSSPEYYEKKALADRWRRFYNKAVHNELDDVYKDAWGNYKLFDLDRPFADQVNEVKGDVPNEFNAPDVVVNKNVDNESGAEYHEYKQDEPSSITYKDRYKAFKQREANREKTAGLRKERKEVEDSYNSKSEQRLAYNKQLMKEYMDEHGLSSENDIPYDVWDNLRSKSFEKYQDELDSLFNKYKDLDKQIKAVAEPRFSLKDEKIKSVAEKFGVNEDDVAMYANAVERGSTADAARARVNIKRYLLQANEDKISSFHELMKYTVPVNETLKENFGDLDAMIEERRKQIEAERNAMEAARKRAQEEEEKRQKHLDELSLIPTDELDKRYMDAIDNNDESTAREMLDESARRKGYGDVDSDYQGQGAWAAPSNPQYESDEARRADMENSPDVNLEDIALGYSLQPDDYFDNPRAYMDNTAYGLESAHVIKNALDAIKNGEKDVKVKVYRAVPTSVKEGKLRNGDWVTPSKKYAEMHGDNRLEGKYRIIEDEVPANQLWWDGNDANEFGFDDGKEYRYKNAKNNRKLNDLITYDNKGNVIPPSKRFNSRKKDIRFSLAGERGAAAADKAEERTFRMDNLSVARKMEEWVEKNHLEKGAVPMEKPIMKEGENIFDYANRMVEWTRNQNLWKTAPKQTGFQDALDKWKADNGLSPDAYPPVRPHRENYSTEIGYSEDLEEYNKKKELWKSAPKPKDFDLSVDLEDMNKQLRNIRRAVLNQKNYDQRTVKAVSDLVRKMLNIGWGDGLSRGKVGNLLSAAKNATGANDVKKYLDKAMGILAENYLNRLSTAYDNLINTKGARADQSGVIKMGSLDAKGQAFMSEYKKAINMDDKSLDSYIANIEEDSAKNEDNVEMNDYRLAGIQAAIMYKQQIGGNDADIAELKRQIGELKNKKDATKEDKDLLKSLEKKLFENKFDRITMYENLLNNIQRMVKESKGRAKEFREEIAEHKNEILHRANLDLEGVDSTYYDTTTAKKKFVNNDLQRAVFSSTYTFEQFLKFFGKKAANGEGYLYNYFTKLNQDALDEEQLYNEMNRNALDEKTKELFGKEKFMKLVGIDGKGMKEMDVEVTDYSNKETGKRTIHLKQGQMLYIYLVNKETDGEMKLRAMGITEEDVAAIEENLDPRVKAMGEWLQDEYLPECQRRYQATHTKYFGAPMKEVENYFPLAINNRARNVKEDVNQDSDAMSQLAGTSTGAIVTRRVNVIPLDIENADAFEVAFNHLQEMEEWSAMLPFRQDINTLLSYTHFRNQVQNMSSVAYGSGKTLWDEFKQTAQIAAGTYKPKVNAGMMDSRIAAAMGGIAVAKISGRLWTAIKQSQSATVFLPECDFTRFVKNGVNPYGSWKWAMENIPDFRKRVENMTYGDVKLRQYLDELEKWHDWTKTISKIGMAPNILVDGITCAVGARSVYETEVNRLTKLGYPKEKAEEKAYYKAVAAYNKTQQSSGGMYLSPMQVDRTYASAALSLFKNANFAYGRMQIEACRGLARTYDFWGGKHKTTLIESMTRQIMEEDGLDENTARAIAKATYNRTFRQSIGRLINFATLVPVSWALYKVLPYLLTGDDDDKKKDMIEEAVLKGFATSLSDNYVIPFASNILNAGLKVEDGKPTFDPEVFKWQNLYINPATSDLANIYSMIGNQKWYSVANKLGMLGVQSLIGFNPETVGALYQAFAEADYDNGNTAKEWQIGILKAISAPEETIRELYMDELGLKSGDIKKIPLAELEKRYAERQINRDNLLSQIGMDAETFNGYVDKYQKSFEKKIKDKMDKWDEYDKKKADEFFDTTSDTKLKDMIEKKRTKDANAAADEQIAKEGLNQEKKGKEPSEEAYDAVKMSIDVAEDNAISTYNKVLNKRYAALNDEYNEQTDAMKYIFMSKHPYFKAYKDLESEYTTYGKKMKELKEKLVSADGYDAKQTILKQIRAEREKFSELQSKVR
jgi:hypothetical protein